MIGLQIMFNIKKLTNTIYDYEPIKIVNHNGYINTHDANKMCTEVLILRHKYRLICFYFLNNLHIFAVFFFFQNVMLK
jgi:hypothetical protein